MADFVLIVLAVVFLAGAIAGGMLLVCMASLREDRMRLGERAPDRICRAGRLVTGLKVVHHDPWAGQRGQPLSAKSGRYQHVPPAEEDPGF